MEQPEPEAQDIALTMELYTSGSLDIFAHETNVDTKNRIISYDIHDLSEDLKQPGFVTITDAMLNRVNFNWAQGKKTHVIVDEFHIAYENEYSGNFFTSAWRQFRKRNASPVAITQNVDYLLDAPQARSMLSNSEFIVMLNQAEKDQERLSQLLNISPEQMRYVNGSEAGSGLLRYGNALVPFINKFPMDTELYRLITTRPGEGVFAKGQVDFAGMTLASDEDDTEILPISEEVMAYEPIIQQYAREHGIGDYVLLIQAVMMQESGGRGNDPMQCSECNFNTLYPHVPGGITDPEYSINVGIQNLADCLQIARCESPMDMDAVKLALQGYNYGQGYITWAMNKYGEYSQANAIEFSMKTAEAYGWDSYGDMDYVPHVLRYYPLGQIFYEPDTSTLIVEVAKSQIGNVGGEPYWSWYGFTERVDWCACFVSWCANQCGYIEAGVIPKFSGCEWGVYWFRQHDQWAGRNITPTPGMIIFFDW